MYGNNLITIPLSQCCVGHFQKGQHHQHRILLIFELKLPALCFSAIIPKPFRFGLCLMIFQHFRRVSDISDFQTLLKDISLLQTLFEIFQTQFEGGSTFMQRYMSPKVRQIAIAWQRQHPNQTFIVKAKQINSYSYQLRLRLRLG